MQALLEVLTEGSFRAALGREPGYDARETGREALQQG